VRMSPPRAGRAAALPHFSLLAHAAYPYSKAVRGAILAAMNAPTANVAALARLNFLLGELYAEAVLATGRRFALRPDLVGCHGQTIFHQGKAQRYLGRKLAVTWQIGEGAVIAARLGVPVVSDFRPIFWLTATRSWGGFCKTSAGSPI
jgi:anhydro-N-acetylmuramic acid kinase